MVTGSYGVVSGGYRCLRVVIGSYGWLRMGGGCEN